ncbi:MAG: ThuA domain-containing protein [Cyclobacteriaceae bacterium]
MKKGLAVSIVLILCCWFGYAQPNTSKDKISVLIVDGFSNHDWKQTTYVVKTILERSGLFEVSVSTSPSEPEDDAWNNWNPKFKDYDVVIQNSNNIFNKKIEWPEIVQKQLEKYVNAGGGLYIHHSANNAFANWQEYNRMIGLGWRKPDQGIALQVEETGQIKRIPIGEGRGTYHGPRNDEVIQIIKDHPINKGFPKAWKTPDMELYKFARGPAENLTVLSYAKDEETDINWPVEWIVKYGNGKIYNSSMGHLWKGQTYPISYRCIGFQTTLIRATEWLASGKTTYELPTNFPTESEIKTTSEDYIK